MSPCVHSDAFSCTASSFASGSTSTEDPYTAQAWLSPCPGGSVGATTTISGPPRFADSSLYCTVIAERRLRHHGAVGSPRLNAAGLHNDAGVASVGGQHPDRKRDRVCRGGARDPVARRIHVDAAHRALIVQRTHADGAGQPVRVRGGKWRDRQRCDAAAAA